MKVLFLDIDGVLSTFNSDRLLDPEPVAHFKLIQEKVKDLQIVITSSWRASEGMPRIKEIFTSFGIDCSRITGETPSFSNIRGREIAAWLDGRKFDKMVILDDEDDVSPYSKYLHQTGCNEGLTYDIALDIIEYFNE